MKLPSQSMCASIKASSFKQRPSSIKSQLQQRFPQYRDLTQSVSESSLPDHHRHTKYLQQSSSYRDVPILSSNTRILQEIEDEKKSQLLNNNDAQESQEFDFDLCSHLQNERIQTQLKQFMYTCSDTKQDDNCIESNHILRSYDMNEVRDLFLKMREVDNSTIKKNEILNYFGKFVPYDALNEIFQRIAMQPEVLTFAEFKIFYIEFVSYIDLEN